MRMRMRMRRGGGGDVVKTPACRTSTDRQRLSMGKLTSSNSDPTLAVTSSIPVPCAAVSFPAIMLCVSLAGGYGDLHGGL